MIDFNRLAVFRLEVGAHPDAKAGLCAMEAVAWLEGLKHTDRPSCTCPAIGDFVRTFNDALSAGPRQRLIAYLPRLVGTVAQAFEEERGRMLSWYGVAMLLRFQMAKIGVDIAPPRPHAWPRVALISECYAVACTRPAMVAREVACEVGRLISIVATSGPTVAALQIVLAINRNQAWDIGFALLDRMLAIGPVSPGFSVPSEPRVEEYRELLNA